MSRQKRRYRANQLERLRKTVEATKKAGLLADGTEEGKEFLGVMIEANRRLKGSGRAWSVIDHAEHLGLKTDYAVHAKIGDMVAEKIGEPEHVVKCVAYGPEGITNGRRESGDN